MQDEDYELAPHAELEYLRREVEKLKRNPLGDTQASVSLLESINKLNVSISRLNDILAGANDEMIRSFAETSTQDQIRKMLEQQEKLARGIVAVADLVKSLEKPAEPPAIKAEPVPQAPPIMDVQPNPFMDHPQPPGFTQFPPAMPPMQQPPPLSINDIEVPLPPRRR